MESSGWYAWSLSRPRVRLRGKLTGQFLMCFHQAEPLAHVCREGDSSRVLIALKSAREHQLGLSTINEQSAQGVEIVKVTVAVILLASKNCGLTTKYASTVNPSVFAVGGITFMIRGPARTVAAVVYVLKLLAFG